MPQKPLQKTSAKKRTKKVASPAIIGVASPTIEFVCSAEHFDVIPKPYPAKKLMPDWFKALPARLGEAGFESSTLKRCMPFLDVLSAGYIIPLVADVFVKTNEDASEFKSEWRYPDTNKLRERGLPGMTVIESHNMAQITSSDLDKEQNPNAPKPAMKFMNFWLIKTPPEYSLLFVPPLNRPNKQFTCYAGLVDAPYPGLEYVNFPFHFHEKKFSGLLEAGTPLIQVIPILKKTLLNEHIIRPMTREDLLAQEKLRKQRAVHESHYRDNVRKDF